MLNSKERQEQLNAMTIQVLKDTFKPIYGLSFKRCKRKADIIAEIVDYEIFLAETYEECNGLEGAYDFAVARKAKCEAKRKAKREAKNNTAEPIWWNLVCEMNMKDGNPFVYEHVADRPLLQQIMLHVCRELYLDSQRAIKAANGDKTVKQFGPVYVGKKHNGLHMKDAMAKGTVKAAAEKVLPQELRKKYIVLNSETKHTEFKKAVELLKRLENAGLIIGEKTDKDYAKFYTVYPDKILAFLQAVGCLKQ